MDNVIAHIGAVTQSSARLIVELLGIIERLALAILGMLVGFGLALLLMSIVAMM